MTIDAKDILWARTYYCGNMEAKKLVHVITTKGNFILSPKEYRQISGRPRARLVEGAV